MRRLNSGMLQRVIMKVKFILDTGWHVAPFKTHSSSGLKPAVSAILAAFFLLLTVAASSTPSLAQQADPTSAAKPDAQAQADTPTAPDPSSDDSTEAMF